MRALAKGPDLAPPEACQCALSSLQLYVDKLKLAYTSARTGRALFWAGFHEEFLGNRWSLIVQLQWLRCNTLQKESLKREICVTDFVTRNLFGDAENRAPSPVQSVKTRSFAAHSNRSLPFSTFFFTELLKRGGNYWKQICAAIIREPSAKTKNTYTVEWFRSCRAKRNINPSLPPKSKNAKQSPRLLAKLHPGNKSRSPKCCRF